MILANEYGLFRPEYFRNLSAEELILADMRLLSRIYEEERKAHDRAKERAEHPGMERFETVDEFWDEVKEANEGEG